jgi:uncharacterized protein YjdB
MMKRAATTVLSSCALLCSFLFLQDCQFWGEMDNPLDKRGSFVHVASVGLEPASIDLEVGDTYQLAASISPEDADNKAVSWTVVNPSVATVSASGLVSAAALGTTTVTVASADGGKSDSCTIKVMVKVPVDGVSLSKDATAIAVGATEQLIPVITPLDAYDQRVTWTSSDTSVASVSADGTVEVLKLGTSTITVTTVDGGKTDSCLVTGIDPIHPTGVSVAPETATVKVGSTQQLAATVSPSDATNKSVSWSSNYPAIASVNSSGLVYGLSIGTAVITATTVDGSFTDTSAVTVPEIAVSGVSLNKTTAEILVGSTTQLTATVAPPDATSKAVEWTSDNEAVATVSSAGLVSAHSVGTATITVRTLSGGKIATCAVTTIQPVPVTGISLDKHTDTLLKGCSHQLIATLQPIGATTRGVIWTSSKPNVVSVSTTGIIVGIAIGTATITVTTIDGAKTDECVVTVSSDATTDTYFIDDFESGLGNWTVNGYDWAITDSTYWSSSHSATESPAGNYINNENATMTLTQSIDLSSAMSPVLSFWSKVSLGWSTNMYGDIINIDYCYIDISINGGLSWATLGTFGNGHYLSWFNTALDLSSYAGQSIKIRFRLVDNASSGTAEGFTIDDVVVAEKDTERIAYPFSDGFENGTANWMLSDGSEWRLTETSHMSASHSISESPDGNYLANAYSQLIIKHPVDLSTAKFPVLSYWHKISVAWGSNMYGDIVSPDYGYVQVSQDCGITWTTLKQYGVVNQTSWLQEIIDLSLYVGKSVLIRFALRDDYNSATADGWTIDDIEIHEQ